MRPVGISIGDFNFRVTFYSKSEGAVDAIGNPTLTLGSAVDRWANVVYKNSPISDVNGIEYQFHYEIKVRKPLTISAGDRVDFEGNELLILNVSDADKVMLNIKAIGKS